jgi:hypothetical protein
MKQVHTIGATWTRQLAVVLAVMSSACQTAEVVEADLDEPYFRCRVQPVLDERCSMLECHGDVQRPLRVYTRNRLRLDAEPVQLNLPLSGDELRLNFDGAASFAGDERPVQESFLLRKPLDEAAGGYYHEGRELYLRGDVFASEEDSDYQTLLQWVLGETEDPACTYLGQTDGAQGETE